MTEKINECMNAFFKRPFVHIPAVLGEPPEDGGIVTSHRGCPPDSVFQIEKPWRYEAIHNIELQVNGEETVSLNSK